MDSYHPEKTWELCAWCERRSEGRPEEPLEVRRCPTCQAHACFRPHDPGPLCELHADGRRGFLVWTPANIHKVNVYLRSTGDERNATLKFCSRCIMAAPFAQDNDTDYCELCTRNLLGRYCVKTRKFCVFPADSRDRACPAHKEPTDDELIPDPITPVIPSPADTQHPPPHIQTETQPATNPIDTQQQPQPQTQTQTQTGPARDTTAHRESPAPPAHAHRQTGADARMQETNEPAEPESEDEFGGRGAARTATPPLLAQRRRQECLVRQLTNREIGVGKWSAQRFSSRAMYQCIYPTTTVKDVAEPHPFIVRRFSPCGNYLLGIDRNGKAVLYTVQWPTWWEEETPNEASLKMGLFDQFFQFHAEITGLWPESDVRQEQRSTQTLCRDISLFTEHSRYLVLASTCPAQGPALRPVSPVPANTHSAWDYDNIPSSGQEVLHNVGQLEDTVLHLARVSNGVRCDAMRLRNDCIPLTSLNSGLYLHNNTLAILSLQYQTIHIITIRQSGAFVPTRKIGLYCFDSDKLLVSAYFSSQRRRTHSPAPPLQAKTPPPSTLTVGNGPDPPHLNVPMEDTRLPPNPPPVGADGQPSYEALLQAAGSAPTTEGLDAATGLAPLGGLKQRILAYLYRHALHSGKVSSMANLYFHFRQYEDLAMLRMQLVDDEHLLIRYGSKDAAAARSTDTTLQTMFYVLYNMVTTDVIGVYENSSEELLKILLEGSDYLFTSSFDRPYPTISTYANSMHMRRWLDVHHQAIKNSRSGGQSNAVKRLTGIFPIPCQNYNQSPYLDFGLYSYDEKVVSPYERPYACSDYPPKFYSRQTGAFKFKLDPSSAESSSVPRKRFVQYSFHPFLPLVVSAQHTAQNAAQPCVVNLHFKSPWPHPQDAVPQQQNLGPGTNPGTPLPSDTANNSPHPMGYQWPNNMGPARI